MRNLKKVLSLVLCVAMLLSVMVMSTGAASFTDEDEFSPQYAEAAEVLTGMGVIQGYDDGSFLPQRNITRAQVATMIYRAVTHDVTDSQTDLYKDYNKFEDVPSTDWSAGYVGYCANGELIKGFTPTTFGPNKNVTGYQVLAMILRAIGYDQNDEFTGSGWEIRTATTAQQLGILENVQEATLGQPATRELVAELIFQAMSKPYMVDYTPALGYQPVWPRETLGQDEFGLVKHDRTTIDEWGRPGYNWTYNTGDKSTTIEEAALATYTTAVTECDVAADTNDKDATYALYVNSKANNAGQYTVQATDTVNKIGAQGRQTEVYTDRIVMIDTMLAQVTNVTNYKADASGHVYTPAKLTLEIFDVNTSSLTGGTPVTLESYTDNYSYTKGEMLLVNTYTVATNNATSHGNAISNADTQYVEIVGTPTSVVGSQTVIHYNDGKHTVNGTDYIDAACLHLDQAGKDTAQHTWYFDLNNNLIGVTDIAATYNYGTIKNIQWINPQGANGYAQATLVLMDGSEVTKTVVGLNGYGLTYSTPTATAGTVVGNNYVISTSMAENNGITGDGLYQISETAAGVSLKWVNRTDVQSTVSDSGRMTNASITNKQAYINGTATAPANDSTIVTDEATQYLVRTGSQGSYVYTPVTGVNNIGNYTNATVDYVDVDNDGRAEYVYLWGSDVNATYTGLFYPTTLSYREVLVDGTKTVDYYVMTGYVDGNTTLTEMIIPAADKVDTLDVILNGGANQLYMIDFVNGEATVAEKVTSTASWIDQNSGKYSNPDQAAYYGNVTSSNTALYQDGVLTMGGYSFYVTDATTVFGSLADGTYDYNDIYVVYSDVNSQHYATEIYVADKTYTPVDPTPSTTGTVVYNLHIVNKDTGAVLQTYSKVQEDVAPNSYTSNVLTDIAPYVGVSTNNLTVWGQASITFTVSAGSTTTVNAYAYYAN